MANYDLTTTPGTYNLASGDTVTATDDTIVPGDVITGTGDNTFILSGSGEFDFTQPATDGGVISGFSTVEEDGSYQNVTLVAGMPVTIDVDAGNSNESVILADAGDDFEGGSTTNNVISVNAALLNDVTINAGSEGTVVLTGSDTTVTLDETSNLSGLQSVVVSGTGLTVDPSSVDLSGIYLENTGNAVTLNGNVSSAVDQSGSNTVVFTGSDQTLQADELFVSGGVTDTIVGFNSTDNSDSLLLQELSTDDGTPGLTTSFDGTNTSVEVTGTDGYGDSENYTFLFKGDYTAGDFSLTAQDSGYALSYSTTAPESTAILTTGPDTVGSAVTQVIATDGTLTSGDDIEPGANSVLDLVGGGTFDLTQPATLDNIGSIEVDSPGANVTLLNGLDAPVTLSANGGDTVTLGDQNDVIDANGGSGDTFYVNPAEANNATITGGTDGTLIIDAMTDGGGQAVTLSSNIDGIEYAQLYGGANSFDPGSQGPALVYVEDTDGTGNNTIELTGNTNAAVDYGDGSGQPDNFFFDPQSSASQVVTLAYADAPTENFYGFDDTAGIDQVVLPAFSYGDGTPTISATADSTANGPGTLVTVSETVGDSTISQTLQFYGDYNADDFAISQVSGNPGATLEYDGTTTLDTLSNSSGETISGVSDVYAAEDQFNGGTITTTPGGTLHLVGPGTFYLEGETISGVTTIDGEQADQTIYLGSESTPVTLNLAPEGNDDLRDLTPETTVNGNDSSNNIADTPYSYVNSLNVDMAGGVNNQIQITSNTNQSYDLTLDAPGISGVGTFTIESDDDISLNTGSYSATSGIPVDINIATDNGSDLGGDTVTLAGTGESVTDFFGGNSLIFEGANEAFDDDRFGTNVSNPETITGFDQGASTNDSIFVLFPTSVGPTTGPTTESVAASENPGAGTTTLTLADNAGGSYLSQIVLEGLYGGTFVATGTTGNQGWDITYTACYRRGTRILTGRGEVAIEDLQIGERVMTRSGALRPIRWIGWRRYANAIIARNRNVQPIRFEAGALGGGLPRRDLWVSPEHAMYLDGMLIPASALVNGRSIVQETDLAEITYLHLELDSHDVIIAEGAMSESFVDDDSRALFDNAADYAKLYPEAVSQPARFCAPRVEDGAALEAMRSRLWPRTFKAQAVFRGSESSA